MNVLRAYHNDPAIKAKYLARVREHARLDHLVQGTGWESGRGCAVGCTLEAYDHSRYPIELGIPEWLAHLEDRIFEGLPWDEARSWPERFLDAIPVGADSEPVQWQQAIWRHERQLPALEGNEARYAQKAREAIQLVIDYCRARLDGTATEEQRNAAESVARSGAELAARSGARPAGAWSVAGWSAAASAAWSAAASAGWSASAAWPSAASASAMSAAASAAWLATPAGKSAAEAAESAAEGEWAYWRAEAEHLLKLLANAQVPNREGTK
jgi:hypothetical protein